MRRQKLIIVSIFLATFILLANFRFVKAVTNGALSFNGSSDYVSLPLINAGSVFSLEGWFYLTSSAPLYGTIIKDNYWEVNNFGSIYAYYLDDDQQNYFEWWYNGRERLIYSGFTSNAWHHFCLTADGLTTNLYINSQLVASGSYSPILNASLKIGESDAGSYWNGRVDEIRLYNRALSVSEVLAHYNWTFSDNSGLLGYWNFNDGAGDIAADSSGNSNDAIIYGATWTDGPTIPEETPAAPAATVTEAPRRSFINTSPTITFTSLPQDRLWGGKKTITYLAHDPDGPPFGLKDFPVSFYYTTDNINLIPIEEDLKNTGSYVLDTTKLPDGKNYRLMAKVTDGSNYTGQAMTDEFDVDNNPPTFEVFIPLVSSGIKEKDKINLEITSSEDLASPPELTITQFKAKPQPVAVKGSGKKFTATYETLRGYIGMATIALKGKDLAGNIGTDITFGRTFSVGRLGPPPPVIKNFVNNDVVSSQQIDIYGSASSSVEVYFYLNGVKFTTKPASDGSFSFSGVTLSSLNYGVNTLIFSGIDSKGVQGEEVYLKIKLNSPPQISWTTKPSGTINGYGPLEWLASDANNDQLQFNISYSQNGGKTWDILAEKLSDTNYNFNSAEHFDDSYRLKVVASDGSAKTEISTDKFLTKNGYTMSITNMPANNSFKTTAPVFEGEFRLPETPVASLTYSFDKKEWFSATPVDGAMNSVSEKFLLKTPESLIDGRHNLFIRLKDQRNREISALYSFIVDTVPPKAPMVTSPALGEAIDASRDTNSVLGGIQVDILGEADAGVELEMVLSNRKYNTTADSKGKFVFKDITMLSHGMNLYELSATDESGNVSKAMGAFVSNNAPTVNVLTPKEGSFIGKTKDIKWEAYDKDNDPLYYAVLYRPRGGEWKSLAENISANSFTWDVSGLGSGEYELQIIAGDTLTNTVVEIKRIYIDGIAPQIKLNYFGALLTNNTRPVFMGSASDNLSGIEGVEYTVDGENWYKAMITKGYGTRDVSFEFFHRFPLSDGTHKIRARAVDGAENITFSEEKEITVDTTPPRIGSSLIMAGSVALYPEEDGLIRLFVNRPYKTSISISGDATTVEIKSEKQNFSFALNKATGLWEGELNFKEAGDETLTVTTRDEVGNSQTRRLMGVRVEPQGFVFEEGSGKRLGGATVSVYVFNEDSASWALWDAEAWGQKNPHITDYEGAEYGFYLPPDKYRFEVRATGYDGVRSKEMEIKKTQLLNQEIGLRPKAGIFQRFMRLF